ncbi:MAG: tetratricopeptide repeat protein [Crocinitomicaceae bacterium]
MNKFIFLLTITILSFNTFSQTDKQIEKSLKVYKKNSSKGKAKLRKYIHQSPNFGNNKGWETLIKIEYSQYFQLKEMFEEMIIEVEDEESADSTNSATAVSMKSNFLIKNEIRFINACREAAVKSNSPLPDYHLRKLLVDFNPDTLVSDTAAAYFEEANTFLIKKDYELARLNYLKTIAKNGQHYQSAIYIGSTYWKKENIDSAIYYFNMAKSFEPKLIEPRKYLIDAYTKKGLYIRAKQECLEAFCIFPSNGLKFRYQTLLRQENKRLFTRNIKRGFFANDIKDSSQVSLPAPYNVYRNAKIKAKKYTNDAGIIVGNYEIDDQHLEVYSWREFLNENQDELPTQFRFAQKMNKEGYLDCYVFFSFFHTDIYPQFQDFISSSTNKKRMIFFIENYLVDIY